MSLRIGVLISPKFCHVVGSIGEDTKRAFVTEVERVARDSVYWVRREASFAVGALAKVVPVELVTSSLVRLLFIPIGREAMLNQILLFVYVSSHCLNRSAKTRHGMSANLFFLPSPRFSPAFRRLKEDDCLSRPCFRWRGTNRRLCAMPSSKRSARSCTLSWTMKVAHPPSS